MNKINIVLFCILLIFIECSTHKIQNNESQYLLNDETKDKYYLIDIIRKAQRKNILGKTPMVIIDGDPIYYHYKKDVEPIKIGKSQIKKWEIIKDSVCTKTFGSACKFGLVLIKTY